MPMFQEYLRYVVLAEEVKGLSAIYRSERQRLKAPKVETPEKKPRERFEELPGKYVWTLPTIKTLFLMSEND